MPHSKLLRILLVVALYVVACGAASQIRANVFTAYSNVHLSGDKTHDYIHQKNHRRKTRGRPTCHGLIRFDHSLWEPTISPAS